MKNIDFLPAIYQQREALRQARAWWCIVVLIFGGAISSAAAAQYLLRCRLQAELDSLEASYLAAQSQVRELANMQAQIAQAGQHASLFTYLEHPWPRTQVLAHLARPLSEPIRITQIHIGDEEAGRAIPQSGPRRRGAKDEEGARKLTPAEQDFGRLRGELENRQTIVNVEGHTRDVARLHEYVAELNRAQIFAAAQIKSLEATTADHQVAQTQFTLRLIVRPGYGELTPTQPSLATTASLGRTRVELAGARDGADRLANERFADRGDRP